MYEYPNKNDSRPQSGVSYADAAQICKSQGKRLCTAEEWQFSCSGVDRLAYPYGNEFIKANCNTESSTAIENSGYRYKCVSKFGTFDMTGNVFEWVTDANNQPALMGGPLSKCQSQSPGGAGEARPLNGVRCCKGN